jgi:hypothetical protein
MALREVKVWDLKNTFYHVDKYGDPDEFASWQTIRIADGKGGFREVPIICVVDTEASKERTIVKQYEVFVGDVQIHVGAWNFPRRPQAGELIYWRNEPWEIIDCTEEEGAYILSLYSTRSARFTQSLS